MSNNPYETNYSNLTSSSVTNQLDSQWNVDSDVKEALISLARWQTFFAVLGVIFCSLFSLIMITQLFIGATGIGASFMLVLMGVFYILPTIRLFQATSAIRQFGYEGSTLRNVIEAQRSFWRTIGILAIIVIGLYTSFFFVMIAWAGFARF